MTNEQFSAMETKMDELIIAAMAALVKYNDNPCDANEKVLTTVRHKIKELTNECSASIEKAGKENGSC